MVRRWKPEQIDDLTRFAADLEAMHATLSSYSSRLRTTSPHFWPVMDLQSKVIDTLTEVTGKGPSWVKSGTMFSIAKPHEDQE